MTSLTELAKPDETALQLFARTYTEPAPTGVFFLGAVRPGQILEIAGRSGCGKTTFLQQAALQAILPTEMWGQHIGGSQENVVYIDVSRKFDVLRLMGMLISHLVPAHTAAGREDDTDELDAVISECLHRFHLISCKSSFELLATLKTVQPFLSELKGGAGLSLLLVDGISALYWLDYAVRAQRVEREGQDQSPLSLQVVHAVAASQLKALARQLRLAVIVTKHCFKSLSGEGEGAVDPWQHKEMMCKPWVDAVSQRILLRRAETLSERSTCDFMVRWDKPPGHLVDGFRISEPGIVRSW